MRWIWRYCCPIKMTRIIQRSLFRTHLAGLLSLALLFTLFILFSHQVWLPGRTGLWENPLASTIRLFYSPKGEANQPNSLRYLLLGTPKPLLSFASEKTDGVVMEAAGGGVATTMEVTRLGESMKIKSLQMGVGGPYSYILNEPFKCKKSNPFLIFLVTSEQGQSDARNAIRLTWGNESIAKDHQRIVRLFLLGTRKIPDTDLQSSIEEESRVYHDIIQQDYQDTYYNLTIKTLMGMYWVATYCPHASYVMKIDSDMFVNTEHLIQKLLEPERPPKKKYFTGLMMENHGADRNKDSKWYMPPEIYPGELYPTFCSGTGYVFSGDLPTLIYRASLSIPMLFLEDVYVGICLAKLGISPEPPPNRYLFNLIRVPYSTCTYERLITSHYFYPKHLIRFWNHLQANKNNKDCISMAFEKDD